MSSLVDVIDNFAGTSLNERSFLSWARSNRTRLGDLMEEIHKFLDSDTPKYADENDSIPVIGVDLFNEWGLLSEQMPAVEDTVKALLLYFPKIALEFPKFYTDRWIPELMFRILVPFLRLKPLVEERIVIAFKPKELILHDEATLLTSFLRKDTNFLAIVDSLRDLLFNETALKWFPNSKNSSPSSLAMFYVYWMFLRFGYCSNAGINAVPQGLAEWRSLHYALDYFSRSIRRSRETEFSFSTVVNVEALPSVSKIRLKDIVTIRNSEECFGIWRACVREAVHRIEASQGPFTNDFTAELKNVLNEKSLLIRETIKKGTLRKKFVAGTTTMTISAATIASSSGLGLGNPIEDYAKLGVAAIVSSLSTLLFGKPPQPDKALIKHIAAFT